MALNKAKRATLREKFGGRCAYCGQPLGERWHADHIEPIVRNDWLKAPRGPDYPHRDTLENMNPACPPCNIDKHSMSLESWRDIIQRSNDVLQRDVSTFRRAVRYGLVQLTSSPVTFYFERLAEPAPKEAP
ncbi:HNH endonuclease signature motif containing protein [Comamonas sp. JUb58]|uniref:HNH endonuclease n=1 Tax=Comamonas sp. JUb58 TaxID=2485114 RepID=UPI00105C88EB|nr:HNH endonuclease signature motif containing protein [Comamonas sp. JUb58]TDS84142.1 HNH endonuclease [Comamonas sp. JUb58]